MSRHIQRLHALRIHEVVLGVGLLFIILAVGLLWWDGVKQPYIEDNFLYTADIIEADNTYDAQSNRFVGAWYSTSNLQLTLGGDKETPVIASKLTAQLEEGQKVSETTQERRVDPQTGQYVASDQSSGTVAYVFAPRGISKDTQFYYRHVTYDAPAEMKFMGEETIEGLNVYRYKADYSQVERLEDTKSSSSLSEGQGLEYTPNLQVWIEPTSGWMVKYQDDTVLNIYNTTTGVIQSPVRHFSSRMTDESVKQQVAYAKSLHTKLVFSNQVAPSIILLLILVVVFTIALIHLKSRRAIPINAALIGITIVPAVVLVGWLIHATPLITLFTNTIGMNPVSAVCFILAGLAIVARRSKLQPLMTFFGGVILIISTLQLLGSLEILPFQVDLLLFKDAVLTVSETHLSRMSPYEAFAFLVLGVVLVKAGLTTERTPVHFARFASGMVLMLGVFGVLIQFLQLEEAFTISFIQSLTVISSVLFIVCGFTLMQLFRSLHDRADDIKSTLRSLLWPSLATVPIIIIGGFAQVQQNVIQRTLQANFQQQITDIESALTARTDIYANTLTGAQALFASSQEVTSDEWHSYISAYKLAERYPGVVDMGYAKVVPGGTSDVKVAGSPTSIRIFPEASLQSERLPVVYIEPLTQVTQGQIGYDLRSDVARTGAIEQARDTGRPHLSNKLAVATSQTGQRIDVLVLVPVYKHGMPITTVGERRAAIEGYVFGSIDIQTLVASAVGVKMTNIDFEIYDGLDTKSEALVYRRYTNSTTPARLTEKSIVFIASQPWTIVYAAQPSFRLSLQEELAPTIILIGGSLAYIAFLSITYLLSSLERRQRLTQRIKHIRTGKN